MSHILTNNSFAIAVLKGLKAKNKYLPSKYLYDPIGDGLFQQIMCLEEYYLTRKELEIFETHKSEILDSIYEGEPFRIIELGVGDGLKTKMLLRYFVENGVDFTYTPVDISGNVLKILERDLKSEIPDMKIAAYEGDYFEALEEVSNNTGKDIVFFLGANVGNFLYHEAEVFLSKLRGLLRHRDMLFMGVDLKKNPSVILAAYNDKEEVTTKFNLNLLERINKELGADFDCRKFQHYPYYNPSTGECRSYLISREEQEVAILGERIHFRAWESLFMEVSKKYDEIQLNELAEKSGFEPLKTFYDSKHWFSNVLWACGE